MNKNKIVLQNCPNFYRIVNFEYFEEDVVKYKRDIELEFPSSCLNKNILAVTCDIEFKRKKYVTYKKKVFLWSKTEYDFEYPTIGTKKILLSQIYNPK